MSKINPVWHRMLYSCTHMATVGFKGLRKWIRKKVNLLTKQTTGPLFPETVGVHGKRLVARSYTVVQYSDCRQMNDSINPLTATVAIWVQLNTCIKHAVADLVKPSLLIFDIRPL